MAELTLTEAQNGRRVAVRVGDGITVSLPENAAAGYRWSIASLDESRVAVESQQYRPASDAVGSGGTAVWRLRATAPGATRVELKKSRPWEPDTSASERFAIELDVQ